VAIFEYIVIFSAFPKVVPKRATYSATRSTRIQALVTNPAAGTSGGAPSAQAAWVDR
jgi:hypothetical protein